MPSGGPNARLIPFTPAQIVSWHLGTRGIDDGSNPEERYSPNGSGCTRRWLCDWDDRLYVLAYMLGEVATYVDLGTGLTELSRIMPQTHPRHPQWIATSARVSGHWFLNDENPGGTGGNLIPNWDAAELEVEYELVPFALQSDQNTAFEIQRYVIAPGYPGAEVDQPSVDWITYPGGVLKYLVSDGVTPPHGKAIQTNVGHPLLSQTVRAVWKRVPVNVVGPGSILFTRLVGDIAAGTKPWFGSVNANTLFGCPPCTLLLIGAAYRYLPDPLGDVYSADVMYTWIYRPQTHLRLYAFSPDGAFTNGFYAIGKGPAYVAPESVGDDDSLHWRRAHDTGLFSVN